MIINESKSSTSSSSLTSTSTSTNPIFVNNTIKTKSNRVKDNLDLSPSPPPLLPPSLPITTTPSITSSTIFTSTVQSPQSTNNNNITKSLQSSSNTHVANQVVIIHQNSTISTNLLIDDLLNNNNLIGDADTINNKSNFINTSSTTIHNNNLNDDMNEIKYMKGYVNVLKERFTRKSLGNDLNDSVSSTNSHKTNDSSTQNRIEYQKRSKQISSSNISNRINQQNQTSINNDYQRRRSASPFVAGQTLLNRQQNYTNNKKLFASNDDLRDTSMSRYENLNGKLNRATSSSNSYLLTDSIIKCTYSNEINKDELPKPNFVSSVKNLFEKQINHSVNSNNSSNNNNSSSNNNNSSLNHFNGHNNSILPTPTTNNQTSNQQKQNIKLFDKSGDNLVDRLIKQNATIVYEHKNTLNGETSTNSGLLVNLSINESTTHINNNNNNNNIIPDEDYSNIDLLKENLDQQLLSPLIILNNNIKTLDTKTNLSSPNQKIQNQTPPTKKPSALTNSTNTQQLIPSTPTQTISSIDKENKEEQKQDDVISLSTSSITSSNNNINNNNNNNNNNNRVLTFKERKELFSKSSPPQTINLSNHHNHHYTTQIDKTTTTPTTTTKRFKIDQDEIDLSKNKKTNKILSTSTTSNQNNSDTLGEQNNFQTNTINSIYNNHELNKLNESLNQIQDETISLEESISSNRDDNFLNNNNNNNTINSESLSADQVLEQQKQKLKSKSTVKMKTFFGGEEIKDIEQLKIKQPYLKSASSSPNNTYNSNNNNNNNNNNKSTNVYSSNSTIDYFNFEFIGAGVKLEKSILIINNNNNNNNSFNMNVNNKKSKKKLDANGASLRVNFTDVAETYEYPSFEFLLKEMGFDPLEEQNDEDYNQITNNLLSNDDQSVSSFSQFLPGRDENENESCDYETNKSNQFNTNIFETSANFSKLGSFTNFKPSWHNMNYELGSLEANSVLNLNRSYNNSGNNSVETSSTDSMTNDILPSKEDEIKKWSCDMDSNILF